MDKAEELQKIAEEIKNCTVCKIGKSGKPVPGEGNPDAEILFLGEAPGKEEAKIGRPFVGRSGKLLRLLIKEAGISEREVFITSPVKYLPDRGTPSESDIKHGKIHLSKQIKVINPKIIVLLGKVACKSLLSKNIPVLSQHGEIIKKDRVYFITIHPAAAIRFPKYREILKSDFKKLKDLKKRS